MAFVDPQKPRMPATEEVEKKPWKYIGYRRFCDFVASDNDFFILRRFSTLTTRVLLAMQDELAELETYLERLENSLYAQSTEDCHNGSFRQETSEMRLDLIRTICEKLKVYHELAIQHSNLRGRPDVPKKDAQSVSNWSHNNRHAILDEGTQYVDQYKDLFAVVPKQKTTLRNCLERSSHFRAWRLWRKNSSVVADENIFYTSDRRIDLFVTSIITTLGLALLIVPLWVLSFVSNTIDRLAIITSFTVIFLIFVSFTTVARPFETLGAAAAYAAVLVVFLQINNSA